MSKRWGNEEYFGLSFDYDPQWLFSDEEKELQAKLIELCRTTLKPNAIVFDDNHIFPRKNFEALASLKLLSLIVPKALGGFGANHRVAAMVVETIARYGCASTAMCYVMHTGAVAAALLRYHKNPEIRNVLSKLDKDVFIGTLSYSDPATGGHFWFPLSSKAWKMDDGWMLLKQASWTTSAGFADWYIVQSISPDFEGNFSNLSCFLVYAKEVRANVKDWKALGLRGNQSGPMVVDEKIPLSRIVGPVGDGTSSNDECVDPFFLLLSSACWVGLALGSIDIAKSHTTEKRHADVGLRVCDYPTIQDYVGEAIADTNAARAVIFQVARAMDDVTNNNDWSIHEDLTILPRSKFLHWLWQTKFTAAKVAGLVTDKMLHACGGSGFKWDLGIERYVRDAKAGWVMGPSNEVLRQFIGKSALMGFSVLDYWEQRANHRVVHTELKKMSRDEKVALANKLLKEAGEADRKETGPVISDEQKKDPTFFLNPFNVAAPTLDGGYVDNKGVHHAAALKPGVFVPLKLASITPLGTDLFCYRFAFPNPNDCSGTVPGQYVRVRIKSQDGKDSIRYFSPTSDPRVLGYIDLVMSFHFEGEMTIFFKKMQIGQALEFEGPAGGFEYKPNRVDELVLVAGGVGVTPCLQLIRHVLGNDEDKTRLTLLWSNMKETDIIYRDELDNHLKSHPSRLKVHYTLKDPPPDWKGKTGFINGDTIKEHLPDPHTTKTKVVLCGGPSMVTTVLQHMLDNNHKSDSIFIYGPTGDEQLKNVYGSKAILSTHTL